MPPFESTTAKEIVPGLERAGMRRLSPEALRSGEPHVEAMRAEYDRRRRYMTDRFNQIGLHCFEPMGAFYCFPNVTDATGLDDEAFAQALLAEERVAVVPGRAFGPSGFWPFRRRLQTLDVTHDFALVRRSMRISHDSYSIKAVREFFMPEAGKGAVIDAPSERSSRDATATRDLASLPVAGPAETVERRARAQRHPHVKERR